MEAIHEIAKDGRYIRLIDIDHVKEPGVDFEPADLVVGGNGDMYVVDKGENNDTFDPPPRDSRIYELSSKFENLRPFVDAGADRTIEFGDALILTGDAYNDGQPNPGALPDLKWKKMSGPAGVTIKSPSALTTKVTYASSGAYAFELRANDTATLSTGDQVTITVNPPPNEAPTVNAGPDQTVDFGGPLTCRIGNRRRAAQSSGVPHHHLVQGERARNC